MFSQPVTRIRDNGVLYSFVSARRPGVSEGNVYSVRLNIKESTLE